jgi:hypothetical protein
MASYRILLGDNMKFYAKINESGICTGVSQVSKQIAKSDLIEIPEYDPTLLGKVWTANKWNENQQPIGKSQEIDVDTLSDADFKRMVLEKLGFVVKAKAVGK